MTSTLLWKSKNPDFTGENEDFRWSGREDLNLRHSAPKADALPGCATPRKIGYKKSRRRPTLAWAGPTLPSAKGRLTAVFGMGTGMTAPLWPPAKAG